MTYKHKTTGTQAKLAEDGKYYIHNCSIGIPKQFIEDSRMWEKEYGYEILSFSSGYGGAPLAYIFEKLPNGLYSKGTGDCTLEHGLKYWDIFSVERLSDNVVFSVGDKTDEGIITRLRFIGDIYQYSCVKQHGWQSLEKAVKVKEPILVTEDRVELFENDTYYSLGTPNDYWRIQKHTVGYMEIGGFSAVGGDLIFAKKENAETFIKENKPQYSLNDIKETVKKLGCFGTTLIEYLEKQ